LFLILNALVTAGVVALFNAVVSSQPSQPTPRTAPLVVVVTATLDPSQPPPVTVVVVTATGQAGGAAPGTNLGVPTLDPSLLPPPIATQPGGEAAAGTPPDGSVPGAVGTDANGCPTYTLQAGDFPGKIANQFGVSLGDLLRANNLTEADATRLQIGQVLVIPVAGCALIPTETLTLTPTRVVLPTQPPTVTLAPTAAEAALEIVQIINAGDVTSEGVEIRNSTSDVINIEGWTLSDGAGNTFTFPNFQMFGGRRVIVYTRAGGNTPVALFWGLSRAVWTNPGGTLTIRDADGKVRVQAPLTTYLRGGAPPAPVNTPTTAP
jgi:LysM repeat protein